MKIDLLNAFVPFKNIENNNKTVNFGNLKMSSPLDKDVVSFSQHVKQKFNSYSAAKIYYQTLAQNVNKSLNEDDDLSAFEMLGYDVSSDFETDKITINGDYTPYFYYSINGGINNSANKENLISYETLNINQDKLLKNVGKISGKRYVSPDFIPDDDFVIDRDIRYPDSVIKRKYSTKNDLTKLLNKRVKIAREALNKRDTKTALDALGYKNKVDDNGKITLIEGFSPILLRNGNLLASKDIDLKYYKINENELLKDVVKIQGKAVFNRNFEPDHFIYVDSLDIMPYSPEALENLANKFIKLSPDFQKNISTIKQCLDNGDNFSALKLMGNNVEKDENGAITVNGDLHFAYQYPFKGDIKYIPFKELNINASSLLNNVHKINGSLFLDDSIKIIDKNLKVSGFVVSDKKDDTSHLCDNFLTISDITAIYKDKNITSKIVTILTQIGALVPSIKHQKGSISSIPYFNIDGKNKEILDYIAENRDKVLTSNEIQEKFGVSNIIVSNAFSNGNLIPYGVSDNFKKHLFDHHMNFIYDITNEQNAQTLKAMQASQSKTITNKNRKQLNKLCLENSVKVPYYNTKSYPLKNLEMLGYGSKADIMANCVLRMNYFEIKQYILNNDVYDISTPDMTEILKRAKYSNPAMVKVDNLIKALGENKQDLNIGLEKHKLNVITENPYYATSSVSDYFINLSDAKNQEYLSQIDNLEFQKWLEQKLNDYKEYKNNNIQEMEEFKKIKTPPSKQERQLYIQKQLDKIETKRKEDAKKATTERKQKELEKKRNTYLNNSLRTTLAWALCTNTKNVMNIQRDITPIVNVILAKNAQLEQIKDELFAKEITYEEAKDLIAKLNLSSKDKIILKSYYKSCWEIAGTQEFSQALKDASEIVKQYNENGIDAIENENVKNKILEWEKKHKK